MVRIKIGIIITFSCLLLSACSGQSMEEGVSEKVPIVEMDTVSSDTLIHPAGNTISSRFSPPKGFKRESTAPNSFAAYLQNLPLKPHGSQARYYDGRLKPDKGVYLGVIDMDIGNRNLQQCADAVIRLRAEYLYNQKRYDEIQFNFTNGFPADYNSWQQGKRIKVEGNKVYWYEARPPGNSYASFRAYLNMVFAYAGTWSLAKELNDITLEDLQIGDVFIQGGSPGHAVIVMDTAIHPQSGDRLFLLAQSYMPAQETQILINPINTQYSPWFELVPGSRLITPEWNFNPEDLKRF